MQKLALWVHNAFWHLWIDITPVHPLWAHVILINLGWVLYYIVIFPGLMALAIWNAHEAYLQYATYLGWQ